MAKPRGLLRQPLSLSLTSIFEHYSAILYLHARNTPAPARAAARSLFHRWFAGSLGHPLRGPLEGFFMLGDVPEVYRQGTYEPLVAAAVARIVRPGWTVLDIGAHVGFFTLLMAKIVGDSGHVIAFEAHPDNAAALEVNVKRNRLDHRVQVVNKAVSDVDGTFVNLYPGRGSTSEWNIVGHDVDGRTTEPALVVPTVSLDGYLGAMTKIGFTKIDIEGAESLALKGMEQQIKRDNPLLIIEIHSASALDGVNMLKSHGYQLYDLKRRCLADLDSVGQHVAPYLAIPGTEIDALQQCEDASACLIGMQ